MTRGQSKFNVVYVFAALFAYTCAQSWVIQDDGCRTPDRGVGNCVSVRDCEPIVTFLNQASKPLTQKTIKVLQKYQCGYEGRNPKVCCPNGPIPSDNNGGTGNSNNNGRIPPPPVVSRHRNINLLPTDCGYLDIDDKITNGMQTALFQFPWMALLSYRTQRGAQFNCAGTILNERYILTAAHCISNLKSPLIGVRIGEHDIRTAIDCEDQKDGTQTCAPPVQNLAIEEVIPHPQYNKSAYLHDIGLLRVAPMNLNLESARPVCLPLDEMRTYDFNNRNVIVTGWGATETGRSSPVLLRADIPAIPNAECTRIYQKVVPIQYRQVCALAKNGTDSCAGDSGGPLHVVGVVNGDTRYVQQGLVSFGPRLCGTGGNPGVYTRIAYYMDWILDTIRA